MDKLTAYRNIIEEMLTEIAGYHGIPEEIETELILDRERGHYLLVNVGWHDRKRTYGPTIHLDLKGDKVWLQQDRTDCRVAERLIEKGIPKEDIVLAFHSPFTRQHTGFAAA